MIKNLKQILIVLTLFICINTSSSAMKKGKGYQPIPTEDAAFEHERVFVQPSAIRPAIMPALRTFEALPPIEGSVIPEDILIAESNPRSQKPKEACKQPEQITDTAPCIMTEEIIRPILMAEIKINRKIFHYDAITDCLISDILQPSSNFPFTRKIILTLRPQKTATEQAKPLTIVPPKALLYKINEDGREELVFELVWKGKHE